MFIENNSLVLFQGDSVTDCGRDRNDYYSMGYGYANTIASLFSALHPENNVNFINRGISGNRVKDLVERWKEDCVNLKPDYVSILIGINDCWRRYDSGDPTTAEEYKHSYREILKQVRDTLGAKIIMLEPFVLPVPEDRKKWREDLDPKIEAAKELANEFKAVYIPLDEIFAKASTQRKPEFWAEDGVHPTQAGHAVIALEWLKATGAM